MFEILTALATSAALMLPIVIFTTIASISAVRRGETVAHHDHTAQHTVDSGGTAAAVIAPPRELSVMEILLFAAALFGLAMLALMGVSMLGHM